MDELPDFHEQQRPQAEQTLLGLMLLNPDFIPDVLKVVRADCFSNEVNREIYETIVVMINHGDYIDPIAIIEQMCERGVLRETTCDYIRQLIIMAPIEYPIKCRVSKCISIIRGETRTAHSQ